MADRSSTKHLQVIRCACTLIVVISALAGSLAFGDSVTPRTLVEMREVSGLSISPNGKFAAVRINKPSVALNRLQVSWHLVAIDGSSSPRQLADAGEPIFISSGEITANEDPQWSSDSQWIYYLARHGQEVQIWRTRTDGITEQLTKDDSDVQQFGFNADRSRIAYIVGASRQAILDAESKEARNGVLVGNDMMSPLPTLVQNVQHIGRWTTFRRMGQDPASARASFPAGHLL